MLTLNDHHTPRDEPGASFFETKNQQEFASAVMKRIPTFFQRRENFEKMLIEILFLPLRAFTDLIIFIYTTNFVSCPS